jgi:RNA polymerase sigma-70 factor (ECF subfamily)
MAAYRTPVIAVLQRRWEMQPADAEDLAHDFFAQALERDWLARYDPEKGRFRTFLRTCLLAFAATAHEAATRQKRGGAMTHVSIDDVTVAGDGDDEVMRLFDQEWTRSVLAIALEKLREDCAASNRDTTWQVFYEYDVEGSDAGMRPTYDALAVSAGIPVTQVTNYLNWARRKLRMHVLETIRSLTSSDAEYREEVRSMLGIEA